MRISCCSFFGIFIKKKSSTFKRPSSPKKAGTKPLRPATRKSRKKSQDLLSPIDAEKHDDLFEDPELLYKASSSFSRLYHFGPRK